MFDRIEGPRLIAMNPQERRWMDNLKKAFYESDVAYTNGTEVDYAFPAICKAVDVAAILRLSLQGSAHPWVPPSVKNNKQKFESFLHLEIPDSESKGLDITLIDARTQKAVNYSFGALVYAIRCMVHENENLNADERPDFHIVLNWNIPRHGPMGTTYDGRLDCNARAIWWRVREVLAKFILGTEMLMAYERGDRKFRSSWDPVLKSIHPKDSRHRTSHIIGSTGIV